MPKVLIVDDDPLVLDSLSRLLARAGYEVVGATDGLSALEVVRRQAIDVVVTDLQMPGINGFELIKLVREWEPTLPIVVVTGYATLEAAVTAMRHAGAYDFLDKPAGDSLTLELAIARAFVHRQRTLNASRPDVALAPQRGFSKLTGRERELLALLAQGMDNQQIAEAACLSRKTVRNYLSTVYNKLGVDNRTQAVLLAQANG